MAPHHVKSFRDNVHRVFITNAPELIAIEHQIRNQVETRWDTSPLEWHSHQHVLRKYSQDDISAASNAQTSSVGDELGAYMPL